MILPSERDAKSDYDAKSDSGYTASTDSPVKTDTPALEPVVRDNTDYYASPPPYNSAAGPSAPPLPTLPVGRVNHLHIHRHNDSISGKYTVDVDLVVPPQLLPDGVPGEPLDNLKLGSNNGSVNVDVVLLGRGDKRASLVAESKNGSVRVKMLSRVHCPFRLVAHSWNGGIRVYLPRNFIGPITSSTDNGGLDLSEAVKQNYTPFSEDRKAAKGFIGDWSTSGYGEAAQAGTEWTGDELVAGTKNGRVKVYYMDEFESGGFFSWFK